VPLKIPVGRIGEWKHPKYGTIKMSQQTFDDMKRNFNAKTIGRDPFVRIGHGKADDPTFGTTASEGWVQGLEQEGDVLFALADPTNPQVVEHVKSQRYRYASPEYQDNYRSKEDGSLKGAVLEAIALTNEPFLTRLPEARVLADPPDTFYLDYEEVSPRMEDMKQMLEQQKETNGFLRKLADFFAGRKPEDVVTPTTGGAGTATITEPTPEQKKLADTIQAQNEEIGRLKLGQRTAEVDRKLSDYTAKGIPPAVLGQYRPILLADSGEQTIKLADDKGVETAVSVSDQIYATLDAYPAEARVKLSQMGEQHTPPAGDSPEAVKKLADETMKELGYTVDDATGRYKLA